MPLGAMFSATFVEVVIFTTDGLVSSTRSAKLSGAERAVALID
jgi:hypothetical protein